jgi:hypothetical protein
MVYNYDWSSSYAGAVLESDQRQLSRRILEAELAILRRTRKPGLARQEWRAIEIAMDVLRDMRFAGSRSATRASALKQRGDAASGGG